jgi:Family of unknown function (DUF6428)
MKLSEVKNILQTTENISFQLPDGTFVPAHYHVTEIGLVHKHFIDCGGTIRKETVVNFQLWSTTDFDHRLQPQKLAKIITLSEEKLGLTDEEIVVEYQNETIGKYRLSHNGTNFQLNVTHTDCLASDSCGIPSIQKQKLQLSQLPAATCCTPGSGCC